MLKDANPMCFVATAKPEESRAFYEETLGLRCLSEDDYGIMFDLGGTVLRVQKVPHHEPHEYTAHGWRVDDIEAQIIELNKKGVDFERYPCFEQSELGVWQANGARVAWFCDPDGNVLSLSEVD